MAPQRGPLYFYHGLLEEGPMTHRTEVWPQGMPHVGQTAERSRKVHSTDIARFTEHNPLHYDEEVAKATRFGEIVVQGGVTSAILNAVVAEDLPCRRCG